MKYLIFLVSLIISLPATYGRDSLSFDEGFVPVRHGRELFVRHKKASPGQPILVLLNGLTYSTRQWHSFIHSILSLDSKIGIVSYDMWGMGQTLLRYAPAVYDIPSSDQVKDLKALIKALDLKDPVYILGLSYGGAIAIQFAAAYPQIPTETILMAPHTGPIEAQEEWIRSQIWLTRQMYPYNPMSDEELRIFFLRQLVYTTFPVAEPIILENPFKLEAVFRMVEGNLNFEASKVMHLLPENNFHLMVPESDEYVDQPAYERFWTELPDDVKLSRLIMKRTRHKIPEEVPSVAAQWVHRILIGDKELKKGETFEIDPYTYKPNCGTLLER